MILDRIVAAKKIEIARQKEQVSLAGLTGQMPATETPSFSAAIRRPATNIIAEIKYKSPSHGPFLCQNPPEELAEGYAGNGAAAISVLTDETFFGGNLRHLDQVLEYFLSKEGGDINRVPLLRKDFIIDRYQIAEAKRAGASAYLLIVACLGKRALRDLQEAGREYGLESLVEIHNSHELEAAIDSGAKVIGVNNRDLKSFEVNLNTSFEIAREMEGESEFELIAESGISDPSVIDELRDAGFSAFLIGSALMDSPNPALRLRELLRLDIER